jgi:hypothetical protein
MLDVGRLRSRATSSELGACRINRRKVVWQVSDSGSRRRRARSLLMLQILGACSLLVAALLTDAAFTEASVDGQLFYGDSPDAARRSAITSLW